jgi:RsiW-degrading membrane proteinase PrsW (M82 family)
VLTALIIIFVITAAWVAYTKDDSKKNIKKVANIVASILFWGAVLFGIAVAIIYS